METDDAPLSSSLKSLACLFGRACRFVFRGFRFSFHDTWRGYGNSTNAWKLEYGVGEGVGQEFIMETDHITPSHHSKIGMPLQQGVLSHGFRLSPDRLG